MMRSLMVLERKEAEQLEKLDFSWSVKFANDDADAGTIEGYASVFNIMDRGGDIVLPGAFKKTLVQWKKDKALPSMLWMHDMSKPVGSWTSIEEDEKGLRVTGDLNLDTQAGRDAHSYLKRRDVRGLSIGYQTITDEVDRTTGARRLKQLDLWEISLVTIPMLKEAQVDFVKAAMQFNPRELEATLGERGLSRKDRAIAVSVFRDLLQRDAGEPVARLGDQARDCLMTLRKASQTLRD